MSTHASEGHASERHSGVVERLKLLVVEKLDIRLAAHEISATTPLFEGGMGLDSFAVVELISLVEQHFDFQFSEKDLRPESFTDLRTLAALIAANAGPRTSP